jgi:uncharacterized membrane protein
MPTYYVAPYGNNTNNGTSTATPWATVQFALGAASGTNPGLVAGDTVWIAPGTYREVVTTTTLTGTSGNTIKIYGDPAFTRAWTSGIPGRVRLTNFLSDTVLPTASTTLAVSGDYIDVQDMCIDGHNQGSVTATSSVNSTLYITGGNITVTKCSIQTTVSSRQVGITWYCTTGKNNVTIDKCTVFASFGIFVFSVAQTATFDMNSVIKDTIVLVANDLGIVYEASSANQVTGVRVYNSTIIGGTQGITFFNVGQVGGTTNVLRNNLIYSPRNIGVLSNSSITITQSNNSIFAATNFTSVLPTTNVLCAPMFDFGSSRVQAFSTLPWFAPMSGSPLIGAGTATGAPTVDLYGNTWTTNPTIGAIESKTESDAGSYVPTERNASTITIAPGSTSQSIELYLGTTGLTASTSGLAARYNRTRTASVAITLVARTIAQAWTAGGFAEVDATNMPGVYRLDVPDAAFAAGASDVTIVVRGASGTNGAVLTVTLSSGGLTAAQTASAVWGASVAGYTTATDFGGLVNQIDNTVTGIDAVVQDIPSNVWEELRVNHDTAGSFGEYVNAELTTPVTGSSVVRMGPFEVRADGLGASDPLDIQKGAQHGIDIQCVDNNGAGIDITSATVTAKVYNSGATLVDTYSCTATYAADGRAQFTIDTTVTNTPGTYTATITRTTGASDTQVFGPLRIYVRDI